MTGGMDDKLTALAEHVAAALPGAVTSTEIRRGELCCAVELLDLGAEAGHERFLQGV